MTETAKSVFFVAAAAAALLVAFAIRPSGDVQNLEDLVGKRLNQFEVDVAKRLKIVKFDQETASTREFEVAENDGLWSIPSKQDYPADAAQQMGEAATCLIDRKVLRVAGKSAGDHEALGVIDPSTSQLDSKAEGVGIRVTITDANDSALADMIIGKAVKEADGQYYVRNADQDVVYVVNLDPDKLSTRFEDWIEDDLLKLNPMDIRRVNIKDYSAELQPMLTAAGIQMQVKWDRRGEMTLRYDQEDAKWIPESLRLRPAAGKELVETELGEDEELNEESLRGLRDGLDDLLLVDVERKPAGLSADLKAGSDFLQNNEAATSLIGRGFAPLATAPDAPAEILSTEGEIICTLEDGVEYVLRFGNLQVGEEGAASTPPQDGSASSDQETPATDDGINRYLFVMARFNASMIEPPQLAELPELPQESAEAGENAGDQRGETARETAAAGADETGPEESATPPSSDPASAGEQAVGDEDQAAGEDAKRDDAGDDGAGAEDTDDDDADDSPTGDDKSGAGGAAGDKTEVETGKDDQLDRVIAERARIEKENQRKLNAYQEQLKAGQERVAELNERFGDWYYLISDEVYKKIHLSREEVITKKEKETETDAAQADAGAEGGLPGGSLPGAPNLPSGGAN